MVSQSKSCYIRSFNPPQLSLYLAGSIVLLWLVSLVGAFALVDAQTPLAYVLFGVFIRTFLHTGLFIVTHEAIHNVISSSRRLNDAFGYASSWLYALLPYKLITKKHRLHHRFPATDQDPDYHSTGADKFWPWYLKFMKMYQADGQIWTSLIGIGFIFCVFLGLKVPTLNVVLFWIIPMVISSLQLFTFGIFLPHRQSNSASEDSHPIRSTHLPTFWSFLACYHFGYHLEHHLHPHLSWFQLPGVYQNGKM